jgi:hypothetical protein
MEQGDAKAITDAATTGSDRLRMRCSATDRAEWANFLIEQDA